MNKLKSDYPCDKKLWLVYFFHNYLSIYAQKNVAKKVEFHFNFVVSQSE